MRKFLSYLFFITVGSLNVCMAQTGLSRKGEIYFQNGQKEYLNQRYMYAIPFYKTGIKANKKGELDSIATLHIADSYWYTRNYDSALTYYELFEHKYNPILSSRQRLAELYANHADYVTAAAIYKDVEEHYQAPDRKLTTARLKGFSNIHPFYQDSLDYRIHLLYLNTMQQDFSPQFFQGGMVFVSNRYSRKTSEKEFGWDGYPFANIFWVKDTADLLTKDTVAGYSSRNFSNNSIKANDDFTAQTSNDNDVILISGRRNQNTGTIHRLEKFSSQLDSKYNYGPLCFNKAGNKVFFTRNNLKASKGRYNLEICEAILEHGSWGNIHVMPFVEPEYDFFHPALSNDERTLYFCSNRPGGQGGSDLYYVSLDSNSDVKTIYSLNTTLNTSGNELFPSFSGDTLYYSSDGFAGLGGLDIYKTYLVKGKWIKPVNLGYPVNSSFDDFGIIFNKENSKGYLSSNRLGTDDIYVFEHSPFVIRLEGSVLNKTTQRRLDQAKVVLFTADNGKVAVDSMITDLTGNFQFPVRPLRAYTIQVTRTGFYPDSLSISNSGTKNPLLTSQVLLTPIVAPVVPEDKDRDGDLVPDKIDKCPDVKGLKSNFGCPDIQARINELAKMVFFKTASAELSPQALKPLNEVADIIKDFPGVTLAIEGHTDNRAGAAYNKDLSQRRANSVRNFFIRKGFDPKRFTAVGFGLERPIADNNTEEGRALNRRVSIKAAFH